MPLSLGELSSTTSAARNVEATHEWSTCWAGQLESARSRVRSSASFAYFPARSTAQGTYIFRSIARFPSAETYEGELRAVLSRDGLFAEISEELWARARVAETKYRFVTWGLSCFAATLVLGAVLGVADVTS